MSQLQVWIKKYSHFDDAENSVTISYDGTNLKLTSVTANFTINKHERFNINDIRVLKPLKVASLTNSTIIFAVYMTIRILHDDQGYVRLMVFETVSLGELGFDPLDHPFSDPRAVLIIQNVKGWMSDENTMYFRVSGRALYKTDDYGQPLLLTYEEANKKFGWSSLTTVYDDFVKYYPYYSIP